MRITFVSFDAYPLLDCAASGGIGGAEVRATTFARGLQQITDFEIDFVVTDRPGIRTNVAGFKIHAYRKPQGLRRAFDKMKHSVTKHFSELPKQDLFFRGLESDVLLCFGVHNHAAGILRTARKSGKRTVLFLTSDRNIEDAQRQGRKNRGIYGEKSHLCRYALRAADRVVAQSPFQVDQLERTMGIKARLIRNPILLDDQTTRGMQPDPPVALWVGRADTFSKRADLCVELAKRCPAIHFQMIMNNHDVPTFESIQRSAPANVHIIERVPFHEIEARFRDASLLVNTSSAEGFPNSFLQAGKYGKPVVSLQVDPGNMLSEFGAGSCAHGDLNRAAELVKSLCSHKPAYNEASQRIRAYVANHHSATERCRDLAELLREFALPRGVAA